MDELHGKTAVITGAASGIGYALSTRFAAAGARIVLADIEVSRLHQATEEIRALGAEAVGVQTDVSDPESVEALRDAALDAFGAVHVVCNNAGIGDRSETLEEWHWVMGVNLWGVVHGMRTFLPLLVEQDEGHMVNTASMSGLVPAYGSYAASKSAVVAMTEGAYHQLGTAGSSVGISCLCPAFVRTDIDRADRNRPDWARTAEPSESATARHAAVVKAISSGSDPSEVAELVYDAILRRQLWIFPHPEYLESTLRPRFEAILNGVNPPLRRGRYANGLEVPQRPTA